MKKLTVTGHRPDQLGGYNHDTHLALLETARQSLVKLDPELVITGMALGWDQAIAEAAIELNIPFIAAVPFIGQEQAWKAIKVRERYREILKHAQEVKIVSEGGYHPYKMIVRNNWMVDQLGSDDGILALWNGRQEGGTYACIQYARSQGFTFYNVWNKLNEVRREMNLSQL